MAQYDFGTIDPTTKTGSQLASDLNQWRNALHTMHRGTSRPSYAQSGMTWIREISATLWEWMLFNGTNDIKLGEVNPSTGTWIITAAGAAFTGIPVLPAVDPTSDNQATRKAYVDATVTALVATRLALGGGTMTGAIAMNGHKITGLGTGTSANDAVNKGQMDAAIAAGGGRLLNVAFFTSSTTWTPASGSTRYLMLCIGGGQGGSGYFGMGGDDLTEPVGGAAGIRAWRWLHASIGPQTVIIGAGGTGGAFMRRGNPGGTTSIGNFLFAAGGGAGITQHNAGALWTSGAEHAVVRTGLPFDGSYVGVANTSTANSAAGQGNVGAGGNGRFTNDGGLGGTGGPGLVMIWEYS